MEKREKVEAIKIDTAVGSVEIDSGNHGVDMISAFAIIMILVIFKKMYFR
mgnify:CR=1 FL=1